MHIDDMIFHWARVKPHHPAVIQPDMIVTYRGLAEAIEFISQRLSKLDLDRKKPIAVSIEHPAKQIAVCFALQHSGYTTGVVHRGLMPHLAGIGITDLIYEAEGSILTGGRNIRFDNSWLPTGPVQLPAYGAKPQQPSPDLIFFTSGTTGLPKKVVQTEAAMIERLNICALTGEPSYEKVLILPGLSTNFGFNRLCEVLREGKTACFALPGEGRLVLISTYGINHLFASPQQALAMADLVETHPGYRLDSLTMARIGGAFASREAVRRVQANLCRDVFVGYGSTEASLVACGPHAMIAHIPDAVGFIGPWTELEIVDEAHRPVAAGTEGLIRYRTPFFLKNRAANGAAPQSDPRDIWYYPGDLGYVAENRVLCIRGRGDDVINCGGLKVSAASLDEAVLACSGIRDAGVCGIKGASGIEEVWIGIVPTAGFEMAEFQRQLEKSPRFSELLKTFGAEVVAVDAIPRNQLGKIQRHELRDKLMAAQKGATLR